MAEDKKEFGVLSDLAEIADRVTDIYRGKATIIFELDKEEYLSTLNMFREVDRKNENYEFCDDILVSVSRSFAAVIKQLPKGLCIDILVFYK